MLSLIEGAVSTAVSSIVHAVLLAVVVGGDSVTGAVIDGGGGC